MSTSPSTPRSNASGNPEELTCHPYTMPLTSALWNSESLGAKVIRRVCIIPLVEAVLADLALHVLRALVRNFFKAWARSSVPEITHSRASSEADAGWDRVPHPSSDVESVDTLFAFNPEDNETRQKFLAKPPKDRVATPEPPEEILEQPEETLRERIERFFSGTAPKGSDGVAHLQQDSDSGVEELPLRGAPKGSDGVAHLQQDSDSDSDLGVEALSSVEVLSSSGDER